MFGWISRVFAPRASSRNPDDERWWSPFVPMTKSGAVVTADSAMRTSAVYSCVKVLAESVGQLPIHVYQRTAGGRQRAPEHPVQRLMRYPNGINTGGEWRETMQTHLAYRGNAYSQIVPGTNRSVAELIPLHPDRVKVQLTANRELVYEYRDPESIARTGEREILLQGEVLHLRGLSNDGILGMSPIHQMREAIGTALAAEDYGARFFLNDAQSGMVIEAPWQFKDQGEVNRFREAWQEFSTGSHRHKTRILEGGAKIAQIGMTNKDSQFLEARKFQLEDIARCFRVPMHMINALDRATFNNIEHLGLEFVTHTLGPWLTKWEEAINRSLIGEDDDEYYVEFLVESFLRGDIKSRYEAYTSGITSGWLAPNEVRERENLNAMPGLESPLRPLNMEPAADTAGGIVGREVAALRDSLREHGSTSAFLNSIKDIYIGVSDELRNAGLNEFAAMAYCETGKRVIRSSNNWPALIDSMAVGRLPELRELIATASTQEAAA